MKYSSYSQKELGLPVVYWTSHSASWEVQHKQTYFTEFSSSASQARLREVVDYPNATMHRLIIDLSSDDKSIVIVVSTLNAVIDDQINKIKSVAVSCTNLRICGDEVDGTFEGNIF